MCDDITTCSDPENIFASRWEMTTLRNANLPQEALRYLVKITDVISKWITERVSSGVNPCYVHPWAWHTTDENGTYSTVLRYGALPRDQVMSYLREHYTGNLQYPAYMELTCTLNNDVPKMVTEDHKELPLRGNWEELLVVGLNELAAYGDKEYKSFAEQLAK